MIAPARIVQEYRSVADLMRQREIDLALLVRMTGVDRRIVDAIAHQRYTPSPQQRERLSIALNYPRNRIVWGHREAVEQYVYTRL